MRLNLGDGEPFGEQLRLTRLSRHDSQRDLAAVLGVSNLTVSRVERGLYPPPPSTHRALSRYLGISISELRRLIEADQLAAREAALEAELEKVRSRRASLMNLG